MANVAKDFAQLISQSKSNKTGPYDTQATVKRVEGNTVWVSIPGGVDETPIDKTVNCTAGDKVQVRVSGGRAWITGNASAPPTDDKTANEAKTKAVVAETTAIDAKETADAVEGIAQAAQHSADTAATAAAQAVLDAAAASSAATAAQSSAENASEYAARALGNLSTVQSVAETLTWITAHGTMTLTTDVTPDPTHVYFVVDAGGDYTVGGVTYAIVTEPVTADMGTYYELSIDESLNNYVGTHLALDSEGLWLLPASTGTNKVLIATGAGSTYTTAGTYLVDSGGSTVASFRQDGATMSSGGTQIAHLGYGPGTDSGGGTSDAPYYTLGVRTGTVGNYSTAEGNGTEASGFASHAEGWDAVASGGYSHAEGLESDANDMASHAEGFRTTASQAYSHAEGYGTTASGSGAHAEGYETTASGSSAHAEGYETTASGSSAHAEGYGTTASRNSAHAEGYETIASGFASHAEGNATTASGRCSHAQNNGTIAQRKSQTALGEFNILDIGGADETTRGDYALIIGNGTAENARSNALTVDWSGNVDAGGDITDGSGNVLSNKADSAGFYQIVQLAVTTTSAVSAHGSYANATYTVPAGDRPSGMTLVGIVGSGASNPRLTPSTAFVNGTHSISVTLANTSASSVAAGATVNFRLLYIKATSA